MVGDGFLREVDVVRDKVDTSLDGKLLEW